MSFSNVHLSRNVSQRLRDEVCAMYTDVVFLMASYSFNVSYAGLVDDIFLSSHMVFLWQLRFNRVQF